MMKGWLGKLSGKDDSSNSVTPVKSTKQRLGLFMMFVLFVLTCLITLLELGRKLV